jgi:hypothetical protein
MNLTRRAGPAIGLALLVATADAGATTIIRIDLPQMVAASDRIVVGTVSGAETVWIGRSIYTRYTVAVEETLHGEPAATVRVLVPGGIDRSRPIPIGMAVAGAPTFVAAERAVLMLAPTSVPTGGDLQIVGFNQGRFTVVGGRVPLAGAPAAGLRSEPLTVFRERVRALVRQRPQGPPSARPQAQPRRMR